MNDVDANSVMTVREISEFLRLTGNEELLGNFEEFLDSIKDLVVESI